jgi:hypothetical protein
MGMEKEEGVVVDVDESDAMVGCVEDRLCYHVRKCSTT